MLSKLIEDIQNNATTTTEESVVEETVSDKVILRFSISNEVELTPDQYEGKTLQQLFSLYEDELGVDMSRVSSFKDLTTGVMVEANTVVQAGHNYKILIMTGGKG